MREPFTSTHTSRVSSALTARASASVSANHSRARTEGLDRESRQRAGREQAIDAVIAREAADLAMTGVGKTPELTHVAHDQPAPRIHARQHLDPGLHRAGIGVIRIVDNPGTTRRGFELQSARNRAHCGKAGADVVERGAGGGGRRRRAQRVEHVVPARQVQLDRHRAGRRTQRETRDETGRVDLGMHVGRRKIRGLRHAERRDPAARHAAPQTGEVVVGIDHRGGGVVESRHHFALGARDALEAAEALEMLGAGVGDEPDRGPRELHEVGDFAGAIGADLDHRVTVRGIEPVQRERHADVVVEIAARRERVARALEDGRGHFLDRGLAVAAGDADDRASKTARARRRPR